MHALRAALFLEPQHLSDLRRPAKPLDACTVVHSDILNDAFSFGKRNVSALLHSSFMEDLVWTRIDDELTVRRKRHLVPGSWADLARALETTEQRVNNWKRRGVPSAQYVEIATILGWSVDRLLGLEEPAEGASSQPPLPPDDFSDRRTVSDSDWMLLQDIKDAMASPRLAKQVAELRTEITAIKELAENIYKRRIEAAQSNGGNAGGMSIFGVTDDPAVKPAKRQKGSK
jgi:hypothetical protein